MIERVKLLMSVKNLSSAQLAEVIGVQRSGISHILSGRNKPSLDFVVKVLEAYPDLSESWLLKGEGEMLKIASVSNSLFSLPIPKLETETPLAPEKNEVIESVVSAPTQVNDEDVPYYGMSKPENQTKGQVDFLAKQYLKSIVTDKTELVGELMQENQNTVPHNSNIEELKSDKKLVKLIAIYSDDSFKVYHPE